MDMVMMLSKKNDLSSMLNFEDIEQGDFILPMSTFKQCLGAVGISMSAQVSRSSPFSLFYSNWLHLQSKEKSTLDLDKLVKWPTLSTLKTAETHEIARAAKPQSDPRSPHKLQIWAVCRSGTT